MTGFKVGMNNYVQFFLGGAAPQIIKRAKNSKIQPDFRQLLTLTPNILGTDRDIKNRKQT